MLEACYRAVIEGARRRSSLHARALFIGGKSMGGRMATQRRGRGSELPIAGLVLLGYPLHPPGARRAARRAPAVGRAGRCCSIQGSRDTFGAPQEFADLLDTLTPPASLHVVDGGDHSFKVRKDQAAVYNTIQRTIVDWIDGVTGRADAVR